MSDHAQFEEMLALHAVDALDATEALQLEAHLRSCVECRSELAALRGDAALLALSSVGPKPPQRARQRFLAAIGNEPPKQQARQRIVLGTFRPRWLSFAPIAAALLLAIFSLMLWRLNDRLQRRLVQAQADLRQTQKELAEKAAMVDTWNSLDTMHVTLVSANNPPPHVNAVYSPKMGHLWLRASNLVSLPQDEVYELWLLPKNDGPPMPCGTFWPDAKGQAAMDHALSEAGIEAKGFAVTIEPQAGSNTPTSPIQMLGTG